MNLNLNLENKLKDKDLQKFESQYRDLAKEIKQNEIDDKFDDIKFEKLMNAEKRKFKQLEERQKTTMIKLRNKKSNSKIKMLLGLEKDGNTLKKIGVLFTVISSVTSMFGIASTCLNNISIQNILAIWKQGKELSFLIIGILFFIGELFTSWLLSKQPIIKTYFIDDTKINLVMYTLIYVYCTFILCTSIISNYVFWDNLTHSKIVSITYSFIFDLGGIFTIFYSNYFINLNSKTLFIDTQNENTENTDTENTDTENTDTENTENENTENENTENENTQNENIKPFVHESVANITKEVMQERINKLENGTLIRPKLLGMSKHPSYRNWIKQVENVVCVDNKYYKEDKNETIKKLQIMKKVVD